MLQTDIFVKRENLEEKFSTLLRHKRGKIWSIFGTGGAGKTTILERLYTRCQRENIPVLFIDFSETFEEKVFPDLAMILDARNTHAKHFQIAKSEITSYYQAQLHSVSTKMQDFSGKEELDEDFKILWEPILDEVKFFSLFDGWRKRKDERQQLPACPEKILLDAFIQDVNDTGKGVILLDTFEQLKDKIVTTFLNIGKTGLESQDYPIRDIFGRFFSAIGEYMLGRSPVKIVIAGNTAVSTFGTVNPSLIETTEILPFNKEEIKLYFKNIQSIHGEFPSPEGQHIQSIAKITKGNPLYIRLLSEFILEEYGDERGWEKWNTLKKEFTTKEGDYGLLAYLVERIVQNITGEGENVWKLAIPRLLTEGIAEVVFPKSRESELHGEELLAALETKGIISQGEGRTRYVLHAEIKKALLNYAEKKFTRDEQHWLDAPEVLKLHTRLLDYYENVFSGEENYSQGSVLEFNSRKINPELLEPFYHEFLALREFEKKCAIDRREYWDLITESLIWFAWSFVSWITGNFGNLGSTQLSEFVEICHEEQQLLKDKKLFLDELANELRLVAKRGRLPQDWSRKVTYFKRLYEKYERDPEDFMLRMLYSSLLQGEYDKAERYYRQAIEVDPTDADLLGSYALFLEMFGKKYQRAKLSIDEKQQECRGNVCSLRTPAFVAHSESLYEQADIYYRRAIDADPTHADNIGNYGAFLHEVRKEYDQAEKFYCRAIEIEPNHARILGYYAILLHYIREDHEKAEMYYQKAIESDPTNAHNLGNYAEFLDNIRHDYEQADTYYRQAIDLDQTDARILGNYTCFLHYIRKDYDQAETYYRQAIKANPTDAYILGNYAEFLEEIRHDYDQADTYYQQAIENDPNNARTLGNYATFLEIVRHGYDQADIYYRKAIEADPTNAHNLACYATFLHYRRKEYDQAGTYYQQAIAADPNSAYALHNYADFLHYIRENYDQAEACYWQALETDPTNAYTLGNYAYFLEKVRHDYDQAETCYQQAIDAEPTNVGNLRCYATFLDQIRQNIEQAEVYYQRAIDTEPKDTASLGNYARLLLIQGNLEEGRKYLDKAFSLNPEEEPDLLSELWFYRYAHFPEWREKALDELKKLIQNGVRSKDWNLQLNVERALEEGHPNPKLLQALADVITKDVPADMLPF